LANNPACVLWLRPETRGFATRRQAVPTQVTPITDSQIAEIKNLYTGVRPHSCLARPRGSTVQKEPQEAFDAIRKHLQLILLRAELSQNSQCEVCAATVCDIVKELRTLEAFIQDAITKSH